MIKDMALDKLEDWPRNYRRHPAEQVKRLIDSLDRNGQRKAVVVQAKTNRIIAGHGVAEAARSLGWKEIRCDVWDVTDQQAEAFLVDDNELVRFADDEEEILTALLGDLVDSDFPALSYDPVDIEAMLGTNSDLEDPGAGEPPEEPTSKLGDLWQCGEHRVLCGDCTVADDVDRLMVGQKAAMCFTDPPWNVAIGLDSNPRHRQREGLHGDNLTEEEFVAFLDSFIGLLPAVVAGDLYCVLGASSWPLLDSALRKHSYHWSATVIWVKDIFVLGRSKYHRRYEPIWYGWHSAGGSSYIGGRDQDDVWEIARPRRSEEHPTMKPVELVERAVRNSSKLGDIIADPFLGSGTTMIAAEKLGRRCYGIEIEPRYVDVSIRRWEEMTGLSAELVGNTASAATGS